MEIAGEIKLESATTVTQVEVEAKSQDHVLNEPPKNSILTKQMIWFGYFAAFLFGMNSLLGWSTVLTAIPYFQDRLKDGYFELNEIFASSMSVVSQVALLATFFANTLYIYKYNRNIRIYICFLVTFLGYSVIFASVFFKVDKDFRSYFAMLMVLAAILNVASTIGQTAFFAVFAYFPFKFILLFLYGQAFIAIVVSAIGIVIQAVSSEQKISYSLFFGFSIFMCALTIIVYLIFRRSALYRHYVSDNSSNVQQRFKSLSFRETVKEILRVHKLIFYPATVVYFTFSITLFVFPVLCLRVQSYSPDTTTWGKYFLSIHVFFLFAVGDLIGRVLTDYFPWPIKHSKSMLVFTVLRILFFVAYLFCKTGDNRIPTVFVSDAFPIVFMLIFSITNGYFSTCAFNMSARTLDSKDAEQGNTIMVFLLGLGLFSGAILSLILENVLKQ